MFYEGNNRFYIAGPASIIDLSKEMSSSEWAREHIVQNEAYSYILGRFVEAEKANNNKQYFRLNDLIAAQSSITFSPLNINHQSSPIGTFIASDMQYPTENTEKPYVEALAAVWKHYFEDAYNIIQRAYSEGNLFYSMEAVPQTLSTIGGADDTKEYAYEGRVSKNYPREINERSCEGIVLNQPHFVGGALIVPPARPGWSKADIRQMSQFVEKQWETAEAIYAGVQDMAPEADPKVWEQMMAALIDMANVQRAAVLNTKSRNNLPDSDFAIPGKRAYPIHDITHARNALARVSQFGTPAEKQQVRSAVYRKYPQLKKSQSDS